MSKKSQEANQEMFFPYAQVRNVQGDLIDEVRECIKNRKNLIVHAPTGLGKTAAVLAPALYHAIKNNLTVFFLTSRHTQHMIAVNTLKQIKKAHGINIPMVDIIGKKWMCCIEGVQELYSNEFNEFCNSMRETEKCEFYVNAKNKSSPTVKAKHLMEKISSEMPLHCEDVIDCSRKEKLCPYELSLLLAAGAKVIISDYHYIFHPDISKNFFQKSKKELKDCIIIIDEGHNLAKRMTDMLTEKLSTFTLRNAAKEAEKFKFDEEAGYIKKMINVFEELSSDIEAFRMNEKKISKEDFFKKVNAIRVYHELIASLSFAAEEVIKSQKNSYVRSIANFLDKWMGEDFAFARILSKKEAKSGYFITLSYKCLDPSIATKDIVNNSYSTIIMSGTLVPTLMYKDLLGFDEKKTVEKEFGSPFPKTNKKVIIVPETTTKFAKRDDAQFKKIAEICAEIVNAVPGNSAVFFPSYMLRDNINRYFSEFCRKTTFIETPELSKEQKEELLERFKSYKKPGAVLLGVAAANFSEGIDIPENILKCVVVAGLPLQKPNLEMQELIKYYENKFGKNMGWEYAYTFPAITKCLQSAGRCIRSETDRGVIIFLDERFAWKNYLKCFPADMGIKITNDYADEIKRFFK